MLQVGDKVVIKSGFGAGEEGVITKYHGGTKVTVATENDAYFLKMYELRKLED